MLSKREKAEGDTSALSKLTGASKKQMIRSILSIGMIVLAISGIAFIFLDLTIPLIICIALVILFALVIVQDYKIDSHLQDKRVYEIQKVIEQKEEYLSAFSHRIRTPLNNFSFIIDYLMESNPEGNQKEMLETLIASTTNMVEAVNELSMKSAQEISYVPRKDIKYNLLSAISSTVELFEANSDNDIKFQIENSDPPGKNYLGDPITIKQIFLDLFSTISLAKGKPSFVSIVLREEKKLKNKEVVGVNITTDERIPGFSTDEDNKILNDSMAFKLISGIGGKISSSVSDTSSVFSFTLALEIAPEEEGQSKAAERIKELNTESKQYKKLSDANILLVEDNPTNQKIVLITLKSLVKNIDTAETGKEALDLFGKSNYDIILMDIQLPVMDGITVARKIREIEKSTSQHTPILAITANAMIGDKEKCLSSGMDDYLSKPFQPSQLISIINRFVTS